MSVRLVALLLLLFPGLSSAQDCGAPDFSRSGPAAIYLWQDCGTRHWHVRALGGGDYAAFRGSLFTDGEFEAVTGVELGAADSLTVNTRAVEFEFRIWGNNIDGLDLETRDDARVYLDLDEGLQYPILLGSSARVVAELPVKLGGQGKQYNVVFILTDDQRFDTLWAMPILSQQLMANGINFSEAIVTSPLCCPARASLLSGGLLDKNTGVYSNKSPSGSFSLFVDRENLGTLLQGAGYRTGLIGKVMNDYPAGYVMPGWNYLAANLGPEREDWYAPSPTLGSSTSLPTDGEVTGPINQYITDYQRDRALEFIGDDSDQPFFLLVSTYAPHMPATAPPEDFAIYSDYSYQGRAVNETDLLDKPRWVWDPSMARLPKEPLLGFPAQQLASLQAVDRMIGDIVQALQDQGILDETVVIFSSDNGFMWGEHGIWRKTHEFEESLRVPLIIRFPGAEPRFDSRLVAMDIDIPALVLDIAGLAFHTDGMSLMPLLLRDSGGWRDWVPVSLYNHESSLSWTGIRGSQWKYTENIRGDRMLYDLSNDPLELENLAGQPEYHAIEAELNSLTELEKGLMITTLGAPPASIGQPYSRQLAAWGGSPPYQWTIIERPVRFVFGQQSLRVPDSAFPLRLDQLADTCGPPNPSPAGFSRFNVWHDCNGTSWYVRAWGNGSYAEFSGQLLSPDGPMAPSAFRLGPADTFSLSGNNLLDFVFRIWGNNTDGADIEIDPQSRLTLLVDGIGPAPLLFGANDLDLSSNTGPLTLSDSLACGKPDYDPSADPGAYLWLDCTTDTWSLAVSAGGDFEKVDGAVRSNGPLALVHSEGISDNDKLTISGSEILFSIQVWGGLSNTLEFKVPPGAELSLDIDTHSLPSGLVLEPDSGLIHGNPKGIQDRVAWIRVTDQSVRKIDGAPQAFTVPYKFTVR